MEEEVAALVLRDNYEQAQAISSSVAQAVSMAEVHERYIRNLEQTGVLSRELEFLPSDDVLAERRAAAGGLTAPEFAILLSHTKIALSAELLASDLPDDSALAKELESYFPTQLRKRFREQLHRHPLRREIIVTRVVNDLVNRAGTTFAFRLRDETGAGAPDLARAYTAAREIFELRGLWAEIQALDGMIASETQVAMLLKSRILLERGTRWLLRHRRRPLDIPAAVARFAPGATTLADAVPDLLGPAEREAARVYRASLVGAGVPAVLAERVAHLEALVPSFDIVEIAESEQLDVISVADVYFSLGAKLELQWLRDRIVALSRETRWEAMARAALRDDVYGEQAALTAEVLNAGVRESAARERVETWLAENARSVERTLQLLADIRTGGTLDLARLSVAVREIRNLIHSSGSPEPAPQQAPAAASGAAPAPSAAETA